MDISVLSTKLLLLLFPGIIASNIYGDLTIQHSKRTEFRFIIDALMFGFGAYIVNQALYGIYQLIAHPHMTLKYIDKLESLKYITQENSIPFLEIIFACITSIILSFIFSYICYHKKLHNLAHKFNITRGFGSSTLFSKYLHDIGWVCVRNLETNYFYFGSVKFYSDYEGLREIVLKDVTVHRPEKKPYQLQEIYLSGEISKITIEKVNKKR